jgi:serine/threonine protein kinase
MDFYDENLEEYLTRNGKIGFYEIVSLLKQIFMSVQILHKSGIVHRDIKPGNFML